MESDRETLKAGLLKRAPAVRGEGASHRARGAEGLGADLYAAADLMEWAASAIRILERQLGEARTALFDAGGMQQETSIALGIAEREREALSAEVEALKAMGPRWIPADDEVPAHNGPVLVYVDLGNDCDPVISTALKQPKQFKKKPVIVSAIQWTGDNLREVIQFTGWHHSASSKWSWPQFEKVVADDGLKIFTLEGPLKAAVGDWIIKGGKGECWPVREDIFPTLYDLADQQAGGQEKV